MNKITTFHTIPATQHVAVVQARYTREQVARRRENVRTVLWALGCTVFIFGVLPSILVVLGGGVPTP